MIDQAQCAVSNYITHVSVIGWCPQVWYPTNSSGNFSVCDGSGEDPLCSNAYHVYTSIPDHMHYLGTDLGKAEDCWAMPSIRGGNGTRGEGEGRGASLRGGGREGGGDKGIKRQWRGRDSVASLGGETRQA